MVQGGVIPFQNINALTLKKVIVYCEKSVKMKGRMVGRHHVSKETLFEQAGLTYTLFHKVVVMVVMVEAPHMVEKVVGENSLTLEEKKGQELEAVEVEIESALEGVEAMETMVEVVKVRVVVEENNGD
ncbi:hypothetical protein Droror1_Dr00008339 [Drosera rotundifolia]